MVYHEFLKSNSFGNAWVHYKMECASDHKFDDENREILDSIDLVKRISVHVKNNAKDHERLYA